MTTKKFSATDLPHPKYSLEVGRFSIRSEGQQRHKPISNNTTNNNKDNNITNSSSNGRNSDGDDDDFSSVNLPSTCLPRFSQLAQVIEVKKPGLTLPGRVGSNIEDFLGSYCVIENARPELFIRRDFISQFVDKGTIFIAQLSDHSGTNNEPSLAAATAVGAPETAVGKSSYSLSSTRNNVMMITMNSKQYHRFGLIATKVVSPLQPAQRYARGKKSKKTADKLYRIEIDLKDRRIMTSNKFQDGLMQTLRRLSPVNKIYFRFIPDKSKQDLSNAAAQELSLKFFNYVIEEYNLDGCKPVPLTKCSLGKQRVVKNWVNYSQLHPSLELKALISNNENVLFQTQPDRDGDESKFESTLNGFVDIIDWLGYQLLSLDCERMAKLEGWNATSADAIIQRYDVSCNQIIGTIDFEQVQENLGKLFTPVNRQSDVLLRALILYATNVDKELLMSSTNDCYVDCEDTTGTVPDNHDSGPGKHGSSVCKPNTSVGGGSKGDRRNSFSSCVVYLQDCSNGMKAAREITVIGLSDLAI